MRIAVALSGGGHRAALFGMGVLIALVDLALNRQVTYISSVSGGSITNAFVGLKCEFDKQTPESFDSIARELISVIVNRGILTKRRIYAAIGVLLLPILVGLYAAHTLGVTPASVALFLALVFVSFSLALLRGLMVERLLTMRLFSGANGRWRFKDFKNTNVEHVICCTELASGRPVYFSSSAGGQLSMRLLEDEWIDHFDFRQENIPCPELPVAAAVRASAAFPPGIPPRRLSRRSLGDTRADRPESGKDDGQIRWPLFLSDGGVWNNLATQSLLEDTVLAAPFKPEVVFVANASAAFRSIRSWPFHVPGWAELKTLLQAIWVQNRNTVEPRLAALRERLRYRLEHDIRPSSAEPFVIPVDLSKSVAQMALDFALPGSADVFPERSADFREWTQIIVSKLDDWRKASVNADPQAKKDALYQLVTEELIYRPDTSLNRSADIQDLVAQYSAFEECAGRDLHTFPTVLDRIPRKTAMQLLARGYANTHVLAYSLELVDSREIKMTEARLARLTAPLP